MALMGYIQFFKLNSIMVIFRKRQQIQARENDPTTGEQLLHRHRSFDMTWKQRDDSY